MLPSVYSAVVQDKRTRRLQVISCSSEASICWTATNTAGATTFVPSSGGSTGGGRSPPPREVCDKRIFPLIHTFLAILLTLPVSTASAERSFSSLRRLKTWMRSRMGEERLTGLAMLNVHRDIYVSVDKVIDRFAKSKKRVIDFVL